MTGPWLTHIGALDSRYKLSGMTEGGGGNDGGWTEITGKDLWSPSCVMFQRFGVLSARTFSL